MPVFTVKTSQGEFDIEANRQPSPEEAEQIIAGMTGEKSRPRHASLSGREPRAPLPQVSAPPSAKRPPIMHPLLGFRGPMQEEVANAARLAPAALAMAYPPSSVLGFLGLGAAGAGGELAARKIEGKPLANREAGAEAAKAFALSAVPVPGVRAGGGVIRAGLQGTKTAAAAMSTEAVAESLRRSIEEGRLSTYDSLADAMGGLAAPAIFGGGVGTAGSRLKSIADKKSAYEARRTMLEDIGVKNPTLAMANPGLTSWEEHVASRNPKLAEKIGKAQSDITREFYNTISDAPIASNAELAEKITPLLSVADKADAAYVAANDAATKAREALAKLESTPMLPPAEVEKIRTQATAQLLNSVNQKAAALFEANAALGSTVTNTAKTGELANVFKELAEARSAASEQLFGAIGINKAQPLFNKSEMIAAAARRLGADADTNTGRSILASLATAADTNGQFSLAQLRDARNHMAKDFAGTAPGTMNAAERMAREAYDEMSKASRDTIAAQFGADVLGAYDKANNFWRTTSEIQDSPLARALLQKTEAADSTLQSIASSMAAGNVDELTKFKDYVGAIGEYSPEVAKLALQTMNGALKNAFMLKHTKGGNLNYDGLLGDLVNASTAGKLPFPVQNLGFGDVPTIKNWRSALREFKPGEVDETIVNTVLANPMAQRVLQNGGSDAKQVLRDATAQEVFNRKVRAEVALQYADKTREAAQARAEARAVAQRFGIDEEKAAKTLEQVNRDPVLSAFAGRGTYKLSNEAEKTGEGTVTHLIGQMPPATAAKLMGALKENNPQVAEMVQRRLLANELGQFVRRDPNLPGGAGKLDAGAVRQFFNPLPQEYPNSRLKFLENTVGKEQVSKLKTFVTKLAAVDDEMRRGRYPTDRDLTGLATAIGASTPVAGGITSLQRVSFVRRVTDLMNAKAYNAMSLLMLDGDLAGKVYRSSGPIADTITSLPAQKAFLLLQDKALSEELGVEKGGAR